MVEQPPQIILHHYDASPFSEKVRRFLGLKRAAWCSVITPNMMPKPDLTPLTGGYRRAPVMQAGADIFCDSQVIMAEVERRHPTPASAAGPAFPVNLWSDRPFFQATVAVIFGRIGDRIDPAFAADRTKLSGRPFDAAAMAAAAPAMRQQWRAHAAFIEQALASDDTAFLAGDAATMIDVCAHMNVWWLGATFPSVADELLIGLERVLAWRERVAAIGHGERTELEPGAALEIARTTEPAPPPLHDPADPLGLEPGDLVTVSADDYGRDPVEGALVCANAERVVIARETPELGRLHLHFPRVGYVVVSAVSA